MKTPVYIISFLMALIGCKAPLGVYRLNEGVVFGPMGKMKIKRNNEFVFSWRSGLLKGETSGVWTMNGDTLVFNSEFQPDTLNKMKSYRYMINEKWLFEDGKLYELKSENGRLIKGSSYK